MRSWLLAARVTSQSPQNGSFGAVIGLLPKTAEFISVASLYKSADELRTLLADYLPEDREKDPVLLYGKIFKDGYEGIFDAAKLAALQETLKNKGDRCIVLHGNGALTEVLRGLVDVRIYVDVTPKKAVLNIKAGGYRNFGLAGAPPLALRNVDPAGRPHDGRHVQLAERGVHPRRVHRW